MKLPWKEAPPVEHPELEAAEKRNCEAVDNLTDAFAVFLKKHMKEHRNGSKP